MSTYSPWPTDTPTYGSVPISELVFGPQPENDIVEQEDLDMIEMLYNQR